MKIGEIVREAKVIMGYISPYYEYSFYRNGPWEISIPVQLGIGSLRYRYASGEKSKASPIFLYEPAMLVQYKLLKWLGVGAGSGYRLLLLGNNTSDDNFNSPIYIFKAKVFFGQLVNDILGHKTP